MVNVKPVLELIMSVDEELASLDIYRELINSSVEERQWNRKFGQLVKVRQKLLDLRDSLVQYNMI
jgi:hypothetical protein